MRDENSDRMISSLIRDYYRRAVLSVDRVDKREFAYGTFESKIKVRHLSFRSIQELSRYLVDNAPPYLSYSSAYYEFPAGRPMEKKNWQGSELVFDLDATDMDIPCKKEHGKGWICKICLEAVKGEAIKLIEDFLIPDFGFSESEMIINFSGNRGYHIHINREDVLGLDKNERKQISDYISGNGIDSEEIFPDSGKRGKRLIGPRPEEKGWPGKIAKNFISKLNKGPEAMQALGMSKQMAEKLYKNRSLVEMGIRSGNWDMISIKNKSEFWKDVLKKEAVIQSDRIDGNVTNDTSHLIRLPDTIHGETGFIAKRIGSLSELSFL
ncbi:DNA primase catalytic subunit PriS, partial [Candidatus Marsarchaeota archaeon]|nr:DNA primase catalytic subunit PriS [Candidatus Marsarchaeota archaeon]